MAPTYTNHWGFLKPDPSDKVNVKTQLNDNLDAIDKVLAPATSITTGLDWQPNSDWTIQSYNMGRAGGTVSMQLTVQYVGTNVDADNKARFSGLQKTICYIPSGWDGAGFGGDGTIPVIALCNDTDRQGGYFGRIHPQYFSRAIEIVSAAFPGQRLSKYNNLIIYATYSDANWTDQ